jgi:hypothetical protein
MEGIRQPGQRDLCWLAAAAGQGRTAEVLSRKTQQQGQQDREGTAGYFVVELG